MKYTIVALLASIVMLLFSACHTSEGEDNVGRTYQVTATIETDSTIVLDRLVLYTDSHNRLSADSLILTPQRTFVHEGHTASINELYLCSDHGELCRFFAAGGMNVGLTLTNVGDTLVTDFAVTEGDSINGWLQKEKAFLAQKTAEQCYVHLSQLCHHAPSDLRNTLLIREELVRLQDSIFVRRLLGGLTDEAKPKWLTRSIDRELVATSDYLTRNRRLSAGLFPCDTASFDMSASRTNYLLIYCWADYDSASVDSLKVLDELLEDEYPMKRVEMLTCCLNAPDSAWWQEKMKGIEGHHAWLPAGLSDPRIYAWRLTQVPGLILCDMYNNQQQRNIWGGELRRALDRVPNKSGFIHSTKVKKNGRPNNLSRPARH